MNKNINILSIDPAEKCGFACSSGEHGLWNLSVKRDENKAMRLIRFQNLIEDIIKKHDINMIVFETVSGRMPAAIISHSKYVAVIELITEKYNIPYKGYHAKAIKKFATGNGNASKNDMIKTAMKKYGYRGSDDNVADAICLLNFAKFDIYNEI